MIISYINGEWKEPGSLCQAIGIFKENFAIRNVKLRYNFIFRNAKVRVVMRGKI